MQERTVLRSSTQLRQSVVVKVGIAIFDLVLQENLVA